MRNVGMEFFFRDSAYALFLFLFLFLFLDACVLVCLCLCVLWVASTCAVGIC